MTKIEELEADLRLMCGIWEKQKETIAELTNECNRLLHEKKVSGTYSGSESMGVRRDEVAEFARISAERAKLRALHSTLTARGDDMTGTPIVDSWATNGPAIDWPASARQMEEVAHELADALKAVVLTIRGGEDEALRILKTTMDTPPEYYRLLEDLEIILMKWKAMQP